MAGKQTTDTEFTSTDGTEPEDDDGQVYFRTRDHPDHPTNPDGKECVKCGDSAFIVTEQLETVEGGLNRVVTGDPLCREHFREISERYDDSDGGRDE